MTDTTRIEIKGSADNVTRQELRAMAHATMVVLEFHGQSLASGVDSVTVKVSKKNDMGKNRMSGGRTVGTAHRTAGTIRVVGRLGFDVMFTSVIHEVIHLYMEFDDDYREYATSTLTNRLAPTIVELYETLICNVQQRAAFIAHCRPGMSYSDTDRDKYNREQWDIPDANRYIPATVKRERMAGAVREILAERNETGVGA